ncbi:hypothetical protein DFH09DRAFT_1309619 [Mycena vulgaris]|nr:hypothetical protein DFH09DRAFT_1309619 [Mycena vulgaris]
MPVTFSVATHPANAVNIGPHYQDGLTGEEVLARACRERHTKVSEVLQFALAGSEGSGRDFTSKNPNLIPSHNGFVHTVIEAYNKHHALVIRPDDLLRASFVVHEGKKGLLIVAEGTRHSLDFGAMARQMVGLIDKNVADPTLRAWALPTFTTTTETDTTVSAVLLMATLKAYFSYGFAGIRCGIPRVTLLGEKNDWVDILGRLEKLKEYGVETITWYHLLRPVIARFVAVFDAPDSEENREFWGKVAHYQRGGSRPSYYSGWINAFNVFSKEGSGSGTSSIRCAIFSVLLRYKFHTDSQSATTQTAPDAMHAANFWRTHARYASKDLVLDDTPYHRIESSDVPPGYAEVDVTLDDNGEMFECVMVAGTIGTQVSSSGDRALSKSGESDTVSPAAGWWMFVKK